MPATYLIVESQVTDPEVFKQYMVAAPEVVKSFEGDWQPPRLTVLRFPDFDTAKAMYDSPGYVHARNLRAGATAMFNMVIVEGV
jgi:uncharacterized protein (DUF1330 family)